MKEVNLLIKIPRLLEENFPFLISSTPIDLLEILLERRLIIAKIFSRYLECMNCTLLEPERLYDRRERKSPPLPRFKWLPRNSEGSELPESHKFLLYTGTFLVVLYGFANLEDRLQLTVLH